MEDKLRVERRVTARVPTAFGEFQLCLYTNSLDNKEHLALVMGDLGSSQPALARMHSECFTGDVLGSQRCDCGEQLEMAMQNIAREGRGVIVYLRQEGRGIGLLEKLRAYNLQDGGMDTIDANLALGHQADLRDYRAAAAIFKDLGVQTVRLMTNNPDKILDLESLGIKVAERIPMATTVYKDNYSYLLTKAQRMNHLIDVREMAEVLVVKTQNKDGYGSTNGRHIGHNHW